MDKNYILFDLDGTLTDPKVGIVKSVQHSLAHFGISVENPDTLTAFIGPPLWESYKKFYGFNAEDTETAIAKYREYFAVTGIFENALYPGIPALLSALKDAGKTLVLATSKPTVFARQILAYFHIDTYFTFVAGSELNGERAKKGDVIRYAVENTAIHDIRQAVMVGDREHDIIGAREANMESIGVLYGYGSREELTQAGATYIAASVDALLPLIVPSPEKYTDKTV